MLCIGGSLTVGPVFDTRRSVTGTCNLAAPRGARRAELRAGLDARRRATDREEARHVNGAELLGKALNPPAHHREVFVDPDEDAAARRRAA